MVELNKGGPRQNPGKWAFVIVFALSAVGYYYFIPHHQPPTLTYEQGVADGACKWDLRMHPIKSGCYRCDIEVHREEGKNHVSDVVDVSHTYLGASDTMECAE